MSIIEVGFYSNDFLGQVVEMALLRNFRMFLIVVVGFWVVPQGVAAGGQGLLLQPGEVVSILVYGRDDLSGQRTIDDRGQVLVPLLGRVEAAQSDAATLEARISAGLAAAGLVEAPRVFVDVVKRRDIFVGGDVARPGAYGWRPGLTVAQAVTLAGGQRRIAPDQFGTVLQAYSALERARALALSIGSLQARETRLRGEMAFADLVFDPGAPVAPDTLRTLNLAAFLGADADNQPVGRQQQLMAGFDIAAFRALRASARVLHLLRFPDSVAENPGLGPTMAAQETLFENRISINLASLNSMKIQRAALADKAGLLAKQNGLLEETISQMRTRLNDVLTLKGSGLVRAKDLLDLQTAYSSMLITRMQLLEKTASTRIETQQQDLSIESFAATLRSAISQELETVLAQLSEARARRPSARRAAALARAYRDFGAASDSAPQEAPAMQYRVRRAGAEEGAVARETTPQALVMPGDTVMLSLAGAP